MALVLWVEALVGLGVVEQQVARLELFTKLISESLHLLHERSHSLQVKHAEWTTKERRESDTEHGTDITISRGSDNAIFQTLDGFIHESASVCQVVQIF